jgi:GNAT superfamily N-acetyltransferase
MRQSILGVSEVIVMTGKTYRDPSLSLRPARWADINAVAKLTHDVAEIEGDSLFVLPAEELANEWKSNGFNVERDVFVVETRDRRLVGSEEFYNESGHNKLKADGCVHPEFRGLGIISSLLEKMAERTHAEMKLAPPDARVFNQCQVSFWCETRIVGALV